MNQRTLQDECGTQDESILAIHEFWTFFSAPPPSSLQHSRHLPKLLEVFLPRWMTWRTRKRVNLHSKSMVLLITNMESEKICSCLKRIWWSSNFQTFKFLWCQSICRCVAVGGYNYIQYIQLEPADMIHLRLSQLIMQAPGYFRKDHPTQSKQNMCSNVCLPVLAPLDSHGTPEMIIW